MTQHLILMMNDELPTTCCMLFNLRLLLSSLEALKPGKPEGLETGARTAPDRSLLCTLHGIAVY